jgi:hypothetical protein
VAGDIPTDFYIPIDTPATVGRLFGMSYMRVQRAKEILLPVLGWRLHIGEIGVESPISKDCTAISK